MSGMVVDALVLAGVREHDARDVACEDPTLMEMYGRGKIVTAANVRRKSLDVKGLDALDLTTLKKSGAIGTSHATEIEMRPAR